MEARAAFNLKQYDRAIEHLEQWAAGQDEPSAHQSIERVIQAALKDEDADLLPLAEMEASRTMVTLFSQRIVQADSELQPDAFVAFNRWLKALESSNLPSDPLVEPLALGAYRRGLFDLCSSYLRLAPTESLNRAWLASKCAFREGDLEKAYEELTLQRGFFPDQDKPMTNQTASSETDGPPWSVAAASASLGRIGHAHPATRRLFRGHENAAQRRLLDGRGLHCRAEYYDLK